MPSVDFLPRLLSGRGETRDLASGHAKLIELDDGDLTPTSSLHVILSRIARN